MTASLEVIEPGLLTTVQDTGRRGYQRFGVPVSGAMDPLALRLANALVGNDLGEAALEMTIGGPSLRFQDERVVAVTGADLDPKLNGQSVPMWEAVLVRRGAVLHFGWRRSGCRAYLAVAGGFDVPIILGSKSTYLRGGFGGWKGRALQAGDVLPLGAAISDFGRHLGKCLSHEHVPKYEEAMVVRAVLGPQDDWFTPEAVSTFLRTRYLVSASSDRMGCRLEGRPLTLGDRREFVSDGVALGSVQVPAGGQPIILMADRQTVGGYPKIATVISADISLVAQSFPGVTHLEFVACTVEKARQVLATQQGLIERVRSM